MGDFMIKDKVIYNGTEVPVCDVLRGFDIDPDRYTYRIRKGMTSQEAFDDCLKLKRRKPYKTVSVGNVEELRMRGIPKRFVSLFQFCLWAKIDYNSFVSLWRKYPSDTAQEIYYKYLKLGPVVGSNDHIYYGVSLKAMCIEFQISNSYCNTLLLQNPNMNLLQVFHDAIVHNFPEEIQSLLLKIGDVKNIEEVELKCIQYRIGNNVKRFLISYVQKMQLIEESLSVYQMVYFFEEGWTFLYEETIQSLKNQAKSIDDFYVQYRLLKQNVFQKQMKQWKMDSLSIQNFYHQYYSDYLKANTEALGVRWGYNRKLTKFNVK